jgi:hypothetical protein
MKKLMYAILAATIMICTSASGATVLFDFNSGPQFSPLPLNLTVGGITADFSGAYSIQDVAGYIGVTPAGFSGLGLLPNGINTGALQVDFPQESITDFSILVAPQDLNTSAPATLRVTAYMDGVFVGTSTSMGSEPFFWDPSTLSFSSPQGFNRVVVNYDSPPPNAPPEDFGTIFVADNMTVTGTIVPEPSAIILIAGGILGLLGRHWCRKDAIVNA